MSKSTRSPDSSRVSPCGPTSQGLYKLSLPELVIELPYTVTAYYDNCAISGFTMKRVKMASQSSERWSGHLCLSLGQTSNGSYVTTPRKSHGDRGYVPTRPGLRVESKRRGFFHIINLGSLPFLTFQYHIHIE